jgi:hypothetical protein
MKPGSPGDWLSKAASHCEDLIFDQRLLLDNARIRFALDFNDLRDFLRPWRAPITGEQEPLLESILATAYLIYDMDKKPQLKQTLLLPEYLQEYVEHAAYTNVFGHHDEWQAMRKAAEGLEQNRLVAEAAHVDSNDFEAWCTAHEKELLQLFEGDFVTLAKLAYSAACYGSDSGTASSLDVLSNLADPSEFGSIWHDIGAGNEFDELFKPLFEFVKRANERRPPDRSERVDDIRRTCERDACALQRVIQLNAWLSSLNNDWRKSKDVVYLLSSSGRFWETYNDEVNSRFRKACRLRIEIERQSHETRIVRHPFCFALFLAYWPRAGGTHDPTARQELLGRLQRLLARARLWMRMISEGGTESNSLHEKVQQEFGSWTNLAFSLKRSELLPPFMATKDVPRAALNFLRLIREMDYSEFADKLVAQRDRKYHDLMVAMFRLIEHYIGQMVNSAFIVRKIGDLDSFPYLLRLQSADVKGEVEKLRSIGKKWRELGSDGREEVLQITSDALACLVKRIGPSERGEVRLPEASLLAGSLLILLDQLEDARHFVRAAPPPSDPVLKTEWKYLRVFIEYRRLMALHVEDADAYDEAAGRISETDAKNDPRIMERLLVLRVCQLSKQKDDPSQDSASDILERLGDLVKRLSVKMEVGRWLWTPWGSMSDAVDEQLLPRVQNNYVYALALLGRRLKVDKWLTEAYERAIGWLCPNVSKSPSEMKNTIGKAIFYYADSACVPEVPRKRALYEEALKWYKEAEDDIAFLSIPGPGATELLRADRAEVEKALACCIGSAGPPMRDSGDAADKD